MTISTLPSLYPTSILDSTHQWIICRKISISDFISWKAQLRLQERKWTNNSGGNEKGWGPADFNTVLLGQSAVRPLKAGKESIISHTLQYFIPMIEMVPHIPGNFSYLPSNEICFQSLLCTGASMTDNIFKSHLTEIYFFHSDSMQAKSRNQFPTGE